jgi:hypothetical protein
MFLKINLKNKMKRLLKISALFFTLTLFVLSCGKVTKSDDIDQKPSVKSDAERVCELVANIKISIAEVSNAINEGADDADVEALNAQAQAINSTIKEIQKRNDGNEEFMKLQQSCYENMNK